MAPGRSPHGSHFSARFQMETQTRQQDAAAPLVVGLTGGIASGKTTVSGLLAGLGAHVIDADSVGHQVLLPGGEAYPEVVAAFGTEILEADGTIARARLGAIVFSDPARLEQLNAISHPRMAERMEREIRRLREHPGHGPPALIVLDAAILFEAGWDALCDRVWTVETDPEVSIARLGESGRLSPKQARARLQAQMSNSERAARAHRVIPNRDSLALLESEVRRLWAETTGAG